MSEPAKTCGNCAAFSALDNQCRAHPPQGAFVNGPTGAAAMVASWPPTQKHLWCLEWKKGEQANG